MIPTVIAVVKRPRLWRPALRQARRTSSPNWWRRRPFLPVPSGSYLQFRLLTQYGDADHPWEPHDVVAYLEWCRTWDDGVASAA